MIDKQINTCEFLNICQTDCNGTLEDTEVCHCYELYNQLKAQLLDQEAETLKAGGIIYKLEQTLTEIKEIAEKVYNDCVNCYRDVGTNYDVDCIDCTLGGKAKLAEQILQKISECETR